MSSLSGTSSTSSSGGKLAIVDHELQNTLVETSGQEGAELLNQFNKVTTVYEKASVKLSATPLDFEAALEDAEKAEIEVGELEDKIKKLQNSLQKAREQARQKRKIVDQAKKTSEQMTSLTATSSTHSTSSQSSTQKRPLSPDSPLTNPANKEAKKSDDDEKLWSQSQNDKEILNDAYSAKPESLHATKIGVLFQSHRVFIYSIQTDDEGTKFYLSDDVWFSSTELIFFPLEKKIYLVKDPDFKDGTRYRWAKIEDVDVESKTVHVKWDRPGGNLEDAIPISFEAGSILPIQMGSPIIPRLCNRWDKGSKQFFYYLYLKT